MMPWDFRSGKKGRPHREARYQATAIYNEVAEVTKDQAIEISRNRIAQNPKDVGAQKIIRDLESFDSLEDDLSDEMSDISVLQFSNNSSPVIQALEHEITDNKLRSASSIPLLTIGILLVTTGLESLGQLMLGLALASLSARLWFNENIARRRIRYRIFEAAYAADVATPTSRRIREMAASHARITHPPK